eukprot:CAMPEP_0119121888 /NCGR_PEP_ID=MMETSP1310-20130426/2304_1 /TAXON_ID=464262 /ORGANISM="Genus nov. species nov., Strain RCC2339" /LENGTH=442 /DNA_ID=CAMNT_0007111469 /DNA_START=102 /DNA_END=1430 /DNA_ORIENTATION=-
MRWVAIFAVVALVGANDRRILTKYLHTPEVGREVSRVNIEWPHPSYSGYFTVDEAANSNLFFWFFPAMNGDPDAPLLLWLNGGPGASSMYGLFAENGPFSVDSNLNLVPREYTWNTNYAMVYIDNPVGAGWSYTESETGYVHNEQEVAHGLYEALSQFFTIFNDYATNDFYVCAESYGGKYGPSVSYEIHRRNQDLTNNTYINLKGVVVADGMMDPVTQTQGYAELLYNLGMFDANQREMGKKYEVQTRDLILQYRFLEAFEVFDSYLNGDFYPYPTFYLNATGVPDYFNFDEPVYPPNPYDQWMDQPSVRNAMGTGSGVFWDYNSTTEYYLRADWMKSVRPAVSVLANNYKMLVYNGGYDVILGPALCENFLRTLVWDGQGEYLAASKQLWTLGGSTAGYVRQVRDFTQVVVRQAGHIVPADQPERAFNMISNFIDGTPFP